MWLMANIFFFAFSSFSRFSLFFPGKSFCRWLGLEHGKVAIDAIRSPSTGGRLCVG
jgi:hypothetical protein